MGWYRWSGRAVYVGLVALIAARNWEVGMLVALVMLCAYQHGRVEATEDIHREDG